MQFINLHKNFATMDNCRETTPESFAEGLDGLAVSKPIKRSPPKHHNNNYTANYVPVSILPSSDAKLTELALKGRKTFAFWTVVGLLFILAIGNLLLTMSILGVLHLGQGMQSLELVPEHSAIKLFGNTELNEIYKRDGKLESFADFPLDISGIEGSVVFKLLIEGRPVHKLLMNKHGIIFRNTSYFHVKTDSDEMIVTSHEPTWNVERPMSNLQSRAMHANRVVAPLNDDLQLEGSNVHLRGSEGTKLESRDVLVTADRDIYLQSLNGSIVLIGKDGVHLDHKKLPIFMPKASDQLTMQYKVCVCMPQGKLFKVPVTRDNGRVYCDRINLQQFNPCL